MSSVAKKLYGLFMKDKDETWKTYMNERGVGNILLTLIVMMLIFFFFILPNIVRT